MVDERSVDSEERHASIFWVTVLSQKMAAVRFCETSGHSSITRHTNPK